MLNEEESQVKGGMEECVDAESDVDVGFVHKDDVEDSSRVSEVLFQADQLYLGSLLPQEIWHMILDMLKDSPEDLINCANASPYFWELQRNERVIFLFPAVFDILVKLYESRGWFKVVDTEVEQPKAVDVEEGEEKMDEENGEKEDDDEIDEDVREELAEEGGQAEDSDGEDDDEDEPQDVAVGMKENNKRWRHTVLNCRLVCSSWNAAIENCYARPDMSRISDFQTDLDPRSAVNLLSNPWMNSEFQINRMRTAEKLMEHFGQSHYSDQRAPPKNPILGRYMLIDTFMDSNGAEGTLESLSTVSKLLRMFGKGLWYTRIDVPFWFLTDDQYYLRMREWLCLMPNLKYLQFVRICSHGTLSPGLVASNPMPKLKNIQVINLSDRCGGPVINEVVRANIHVPQLKFWDNRQFDEEIGGLLTNLTAFSTHDAYSLTDFKMMEKYGPSWKLNKAYVHNFYGDFKGMFQLLENNWANTLADLELSFSFSMGTGILDGSKDLRWNLPHLRRLHLYVEDFMLLDFILPLADTLEYLEIETWDPVSSWSGSREKRDAEAKDQTIQYAGFEKRMHQSNIWQIFKRLKTIKVEWIGKCGTFAVYTREGNKLVYGRTTK